MVVRLVTAAVLGLTVTAGLIYVMHYLVEISEAASEPPPRNGTLTFLPMIDDTPVATTTHPAEKPAPPPVPPPTRLAHEPGNDVLVSPPRPAPPMPDGPGTNPGSIGTADGGLMTIIAVEPNYPGIARERGLEGRVLVRFDVTAAGSVVNAEVVESSNSVFNRSALQAAKRSRFKARIVHGMPQPSYNVRRLFTYRMEAF